MRLHFFAMLLFFAFSGAVQAGQPPEPKQEKGPGLAGGTLEHLWSNLADMDAAKAYRAILASTKTPSETIAYIAGRLERAVAPNPRQVERWIEDLNSETFAVR